MKAKEVNLLKFLQGPRQFIIPIYQRTYSWEPRQCRQLWNDLIRVADDTQAQSHFIGSVVYIERSLYHVATIPRLLVIDGQQRLTTITLLLHALGKAVEESGVEAGVTRRKIESYFLFNSEEEGDLRYKLLLTRSDEATLKAILDDAPLPKEPSSRVLSNYQYFEGQVRKNLDRLKDIYEALQRFFLVDIALERDHDNPQLIFESLNSTGLDLTQADLIRNYILMGQEPKVQERLYDRYWFPMERSFGHEYASLFDRFMRDYLTVKTKRIPNIGSVYNSFKDYVKGKSDPETIGAILEDVYSMARYYVRFALEEEQDSELRSAFEDLNTLTVDVSYPVLLEAYVDYMDENLSKKDFIRLVRLIESYVFRRAMCGIPTNSLNKTFATLMRGVDRNNYIESFQVELLKLTSNRRFPRDAEFRQEFVVKDVYNFRSRNYLLDKLENFNRKEPVNIEEFTIEHIMPQNKNLSSAWKDELGESWKLVHEKYLHTIGNITLTGYNSELSDRSFSAKRDMSGGFRDSPIRLNKTLKDIDHWDEDAIQTRADQLATKALDIWQSASVPAEIFEQYVESGTPSKEAAYALEDYEYLNGNNLELFQAFRKRILNLDAAVSEHLNKHYITYRLDTNFLEIVPRKSCLVLYLNMPFEKLSDPNNRCRDVSNIGRLGNGEVELKVSDLAELDYTVRLVKQSLDMQASLDAI